MSQYTKIKSVEINEQRVPSEFFPEAGQAEFCACDQNSPWKVLLVFSATVPDPHILTFLDKIHKKEGVEYAFHDSDYDPAKRYNCSDSALKNGGCFRGRYRIENVECVSVDPMFHLAGYHDSSRKELKINIDLIRVK